jgi:hypothetical protein
MQLSGSGSLILNKSKMVQAVGLRPLTAEARIHARISPCGICGGHSGAVTSFSQNIRFFLSVSFHHISPYPYLTWGMNNRPFGGRSSET